MKRILAVVLMVLVVLVLFLAVGKEPRKIRETQ